MKTHTGITIHAMAAVLGLAGLCMNSCTTPGQSRTTADSRKASKNELQVLTNQADVILSDVQPDGRPGDNDLSVLPSRGIHSGDTLLIQVWMRDKITQLVGFPFETEISDSGEIFVPHIGAIKVLDILPQALEKKLQNDFERILNKPTVVLKRKAKVVSPTGQAISTETGHIIIMGRVGSPGIYPMQPRLRLRDAVAIAGGLQQRYAHHNIYLVRGTQDKPEVLRVNMDDIFLGKDLSKNYVLKNNDAIYVATKQLWKMADFISTLLSPIMAVRDSLWVYDRFSSSE